MTRLLAPATVVLILTASQACQPARAQLRTPSTPLAAPREASTSAWQPTYLSSRPAESPYSPVSTTTVRQPSVPPSLNKLAREATSVTRPQGDGSIRQIVPQPSLTPAPGAHAPDFRWVIGRLEHDAQSDRWYVRYAPAGPDDPRSGTVDLVGATGRSGLVAGTLVRAEGAPLGPPTTSGPRPFLPSRVKALPTVGGK